MKRMSGSVVFAFLVGFVAASTTVSGCSKIADRKLMLYQHQSSETTSGAFQIDTSGLPNDAIESNTTIGPMGAPETKLTLNMKYDFLISLQLANRTSGDDEQVSREMPLE